MVDNQHRLIKGYGELTEEEIELINQIKDAGAAVGTLVHSLRHSDEVDLRWINVGRTHLQQGFMALTRAVAKPDFF